MKHRIRIKATVPDGGETQQLCPICQKETKAGNTSCPGCGYTFPVLNTRRPKLHHASLISLPHSADSGTGTDFIFL